MIAIQDQTNRVRGFVYPVRYSRSGIVLKNKVVCGPYPKDFGTLANANKVVADLKLAGFECNFKIVNV